MSSPATSSRGKSKSKNHHESCEQQIESLKALLVCQEEQIMNLSKERDEERNRLAKLKQSNLMMLDGDQEIWEELNAVIDALDRMEVKEDPGEQASKYRAQVLELQKTLLAVSSQKAGYEETCLRLETELTSLKMNSIQPEPPSESLQLAYFQLQSQADQIQRELTTARKTLEQQKSESDRWRSQYLEKERALMHEEYKVEEASNEAKAFAAQAEQLKGFLRRKNEEIELLTKSNNELYERNVSIEEEKKSRDKLIDSLTEFKSKCAKLATELNSSENTCNGLALKLKGVESKLEHERAVKIDLEKELMETSSKSELRISSLTIEIQTLHEKLENWKNCVLRLEAEQAQALDDLVESLPIAAQFASLSKPLLIEKAISMYSEAEIEKGKMETYQRRIVELEEFNEMLKSTIENLSSQIDELNNVIPLEVPLIPQLTLQLESAVKEIEGLRDEARKANFDKEFTQSLLHDYITEKNTLIETISYLEKEKATLAEGKANRDAKLTAINEECKQLHLELSAITKLVELHPQEDSNKLNQALNREASLQNKVLQLQSELTRVSNELTIARSANKSAISSLEEVITQRDENIEILRNKVKVLEDRLADFNRVRSHFLTENDNLKNSQAKLEEKIEKLESLISEFQSKSIDSSDSKSHLIEELALTQEALATLEETNLQNQKNIQEWQNKSLFLASEIERLTFVILSKEKELAQVSNDNFLLAEENEEMEKVISANKRDLRSLALQLESIPVSSFNSLPRFPSQLKSNLNHSFSTDPTIRITKTEDSKEPKDFKESKDNESVFASYRIQTRWNGFDNDRHYN